MRGFGVTQIDLVDLHCMGAHAMGQGEPVHVAELGMFLDDGGIRAMVKDDTGAGRAGFPVRLVVGGAELLHQQPEPGRHGTGGQVVAKLGEQAVREGINQGGLIRPGRLPAPSIEQRIGKHRKVFAAEAFRDPIGNCGPAAAANSLGGGRYDATVRPEDDKMMPDGSCGHLERGANLLRGYARSASDEFEHTLSRGGFHEQDLIIRIHLRKYMFAQLL